MSRHRLNARCWTADVVSSELLAPFGHHATCHDAELESSERAEQALHSFEPEVFAAFDTAGHAQLEDRCIEYRCDSCRTEAHHPETSVGPPPGWTTDTCGQHHCPRCPALPDGPIAGQGDLPIAGRHLTEGATR